MKALAELSHRLFKRRSTAPKDNLPSQMSLLAPPELNAPFALRLERLQSRPKISIVMPAYKTPKNLLNAVLTSLVWQAYQPFEIIIVDDSGPDSTLSEQIDGDLTASGYIHIIYSQENVGISEATKVGVAAAKGDFIAFIDHDDELTRDALLYVAEKISAQQEMDVWYSDQVTFDEVGNGLHHFLKPSWSPIYFLGCMYVGHLLVVRRSICAEVPLLKAYDGVQDYEFMLRVSEKTDRIGHIDRVLYKWRAVQGSLAFGGDEKSGIGQLQVKAANEHIQRKGYSWRAASHPFLPHRAVLKPTKHTAEPRVSIIIPSKNQGDVVARCLESIFALSNYENYEVVVVDNKTVDPVALKAFSQWPIKHIKYNRKFNYSEANNIGAEAATGDFLLFLNNDTEVLSTDWMRELVMFFEDPGIGAVGPTLLYPNRTIQHAGVVLGMRGTADHIMRHFDEHVDGYGGSLAVSREVSAVTAACMMIPNSLFKELGRFSLDYAKHYQDVDLCCRIRAVGKRIVSVASTKLLHHESLSRKDDGYDLGDRAIFIDRWRDQIDGGDPYYNRGFQLDAGDYVPRHDVSMG